MGVVLVGAVGGVQFLSILFFFCLGLGSVKRDAVGQTNARKRLKDGHHPEILGHLI